MPKVADAATSALEIPNLLTLWLEEALRRRLRREWALFLLMGQRALLMQIAHPLVARAVHAHSDFGHKPLQRLTSTFNLSMKLFAGTETQARVAAAAINRSHGPVRGAGYDARDQDLGQWVWATLIDSALVGHELFVGRLSAPDTQVMIDTFRRRVALLGLHDDLPGTAAELRQYVTHMLHSRTIHAGHLARQLSGPILAPGPAALRPLFQPLTQPLTSYLARATLPPSLRAQYNLHWPLRSELTFTLLICPLATRLLSHLTPEMICLQGKTLPTV